MVIYCVLYLRAMMDLEMAQECTYHLDHFYHIEYNHYKLSYHIQVPSTLHIDFAIIQRACCIESSISVNSMSCCWASLGALPVADHPHMMRKNFID